MITPIRCGVDTLEATFSGTLDPFFADELARCKQSAQERNEADEIIMCGETLHLLPKGQGLWPYVLRNDDLLIRLGTAKNLPAMNVKLLAQGLATRGVDGLWGKAREIGESLGLVPANCTRIDVALDWQGEWFTFEEMLNVVCHATYRPIYPNTQDPETFMFGKGDIVVRVYMKNLEIERNNHPWWKLVWRLSPAYRESEPVYRIEVQLRSRALKELGFQCISQVIASPYDLFAYGLEWCSLRVPGEDSNRCRWDEDPRWATLRTAFAPGEPLSRVRPAVSLMGYDAAVKRYRSLVVSAGAALDNTDYWAVSRAITTDAEQFIEREMETTFPELVRKKRKQKYL